MENHRFAEMISKIAHELRSPLTSIKGFSSTLTQRWDRFTDEQRLQFVETIHADSERMGRIVTEVLDLARIEAGRLQLAPRPTALRAVAETAIDHLGKLRGVERIVVDIDEEIRVWADPERLTHILRNLIENGLKFSDEGPITIEARPAGSGTVETRVSDEGVGIAEELLTEVFSGPAPIAQKSGPTGAGLGLYLTRRLTEAHGGSIRVESKVDAGSTFIVTLPTEAPDAT
jgi:signal transduction histidine kinase